jgi:hypothetical protein
MDLEIDLPIGSARRHDTAVVAFSHAGRGLGWQVRLLGDDGQVLLSSPGTTTSTVRLVD